MKEIHRKGRKEGRKPAFQNIKDLTNHNSQIQPNSEAAILNDSLENQAQYLQRLVKEFNIQEKCVPL